MSAGNHGDCTHAAGSVKEKPLSAQPRKVQSEHVISAAPPLRTIVEQKSVEEREEEAMAQQPPSPLQGFLKDHRSRTWPLAHMGYGDSDIPPLQTGESLWEACSVVWACSIH